MSEGYRPEYSGLGSAEFAQDFDARDATENERQASLMLRNLGLTLEDLEQRGAILDLGSGPSVIGRAAASKGIDVMSLDNTMEHLSVRPEVAGRQVLADAHQLPFRDNTYNLVISHLGSPPRGDTEADARHSFDEVERILTPEGELRMSAVSRGIGRARIGDPELLKKNWSDPSYSETDRRQWSELAEKAADATFEALREMGYDIEERHWQIQFRHQDGRLLQEERRYWVMRKRPKA